ncbi:Dirigent protein 10 [Glycine soja]|uniref:Dirigent protein 10 n=1 Tax=Glycine soja TaxID=3848 RepID=A0A445HLL3_GLYSO|nr:Dirigent protein 10 [Glycine soja]
MARRESLSMTRALNAIAYVALIFLAFAMSCSTSTRILDEVERPEAEEANNAAESHVADQHHTLSFFMHDILGGSNPTARAVTGVVTNPALNAQVAFAKPNGANLPLNNGVPQNNNNGGILNNTTFLSSPASAAPRPTSSTTAAPVSRSPTPTSSRRE